MQVIRRLLTARSRSATLEADLLEAARAALPTTHLQLAGQRLLLAARAQLPALTALPGAPPGEVAAALFARPFAAAVSMEFQLGMALALEAVSAAAAAGPATPRTSEAAAAWGAPALEALAEAVASVLRERREELGRLLGLSLQEAFLELLQEEAGCESPCEQLLGGADVSDDSWPALDSWADAADLLACCCATRPPGSCGSSTSAALGPLRHQTSDAISHERSEGGVGVAKRGGGSGRGEAARGGCDLPRTSFKRNNSSERTGRRHAAGGGGMGLGWTAGTPRSSCARAEASEPHTAGSPRAAARQRSTRRPTEQGDRPARISAAAHALLAFVDGALQRLPLYHPTLQAPVCLALVDALGAVLDDSALLLPPQALGPPDGWEQPEPAALLLHAARAQCVHRRLQSMGPLVQAMAQRQARRSFDGAAADAGSSSLEVPGGHSSGWVEPDDGLGRVERRLASGHAALLARAAELAPALQQEVSRVHVSLVETAVGAALDTTSWASLRPPIKSTGCAGPAARLWRVQLLGLLHTARQALAPSKVAEVTGEVH
ncbi:hypothetical protein MNEG_6528 [Monoraphidium neglectum]|uniref:Uncharacterized protein n=1 Tax=Monoraphidium neglectum TaxID=145388 RepID=A0A0D2N658_9CHLO|nr:hypothetical protein MNEG_6528 [Monoraphidium neglectum]KIZ01431.1 hypothetical protein MNEG_6528 [Monoraphidium neglectum]|eukprot:XP_013900450.1 hypothetical protein MNEG_6528 [Monoraphidium neglectum]